MRTFSFLLLLLVACSAPVVTPDGGGAGGGSTGTGGGATGGGSSGGGDAAFDAGPPPISHLDPTFGTNGCLTVPFTSGGSDEFRAIALAPDGTIWVGGEVSPPDAGDRSQRDAIGVVKLSAAGQPDPSFGDQGRVRFELTRGYHRVMKLLPRADGVIVAGSPTNEVVSLVKLTSAGTFDRSFGDGGFVTTGASVPSGVSGVVIDDVAGPTVAARNAFNDLSLEFYGNDGRRQDAVRSLRSFAAHALLRDFDGGLVVAGQAQSEIQLARLDEADGGLDPTFGVRRLSSTTQVRSLIQLRDGSFRAVLHFNGPALLAGATRAGTVDARLLPDGGVVPLPESLSDAIIEVKPGLLGMASRFDDLSSDPNVGATDMAVALLQLDGGLDRAAPNGGYLVAHVPDTEARAFALLLQPDGKVLLAGYQSTPQRTMPVICRLVVP
ncbi:MAG: hypothetical protein GQE15_16840 [Archangiaceae bacterium]|nr:hypothetical protein [Archangiaceae bacterium]